MKANPDKCHFICSTNDTVNLIVENQITDNITCEKLLGVKFHYKLTFVWTKITTFFKRRVSIIL